MFFFRKCPTGWVVHLSILFQRWTKSPTRRLANPWGKGRLWSGSTVSLSQLERWRKRGGQQAEMRLGYVWKWGIFMYIPLESSKKVEFASKRWRTKPRNRSDQRGIMQDPRHVRKKSWLFCQKKHKHKEMVHPIVVTGVPRFCRFTCTRSPKMIRVCSLNRRYVHPVPQVQSQNWGADWWQCRQRG